jgi:predicted ferric reductase
MVLALIKRFPYRRFVQTHRWLAVTYLALVAHAVVLVKFDYWNTALGIVLAALMAGGSIAAVMSLRASAPVLRQWPARSLPWSTWQRSTSSPSTFN